MNKLGKIVCAAIVSVVCVQQVCPNNRRIITMNSTEPRHAQRRNVIDMGYCVCGDQSLSQQEGNCQVNPPVVQQQVQAVEGPAEQGGGEGNSQISSQSSNVVPAQKSTYAQSASLLNKLSCMKEVAGYIKNLKKFVGKAGSALPDKKEREAIKELIVFLGSEAKKGHNPFKVSFDEKDRELLLHVVKSLNEATLEVKEVKEKGLKHKHTLSTGSFSWLREKLASLVPFAKKASYKVAEAALIILVFKALVG